MDGFESLPPDIRKKRVAQIEAIERGISRAPSSNGLSMLKLYVRGGRLTRGQAIAAKCADCCCYYVDGRRDCEVFSCPLYPWMPYGMIRKRYIRKDRRAPVDGGES